MKRLCHHDRPEAEVTDDGAAMRERARQACGYDTTKDLFDARREVEATGGPEGVVDRAVRRIERGEK